MADGEDHTEDGTVDAICAAILAYLRRTPSAADTASGIFDWWLAPRPPGWSMSLVEHALTTLVARGALVSTRLPDDSLLYRRNTA